MKRINKFKIFLILLCLIIFPKHAFADGIVFSVSKSADNLKPNSDVNIIIKANVPQGSELQAFKLYFKTIDSSGNSPLTYQSGAGANGVNVAPEGNNIVITYNGASINSDLNPVATLSYKVNQNAQAGNVTLKLDKANECTKNSAMNCSVNSSNLTISSLGSDATLKSLKIPNSTLSPEFNKNTLEYTAQVKDVSEVTVNAEASDSSSKIQISDNYKNLKKGDNIIKIVVNAENGSTKTYQINVVLSTTPTKEELLKSDATLKSITIKNHKLDFSSTEKKYFLDVKNSEKKLNIKVEATNDKSTIKIDNPKLKIGKNTITITVTSEDKSKEEKYQIIVTRAEAKKKVIQTCPDTTSSREWIIFSILLFLAFSLGIVLGYLVCKKDIIKKIFQKRKDKKIKEEEKKAKEEEKKLSDTIELDSTKILEKAKKK